jgi:hypothetical protein
MVGKIVDGTVDTTARGVNSRANEAREKEVRQVSWRPAHDLPVPNPQEGYVFNWKRKSINGQEDARNMAAARREGWVPCNIKDHPEFSDDLAAFGISPSASIIEIGGLVLCKLPEELSRARKRYYEDLTEQATLAVNNNFMREQDRRMPMFNESSTKVRFGNGF